jgi:leucyl aminopeptidase
VIGSGTSRLFFFFFPLIVMPIYLQNMRVETLNSYDEMFFVKHHAQKRMQKKEAGTQMGVGQSSNNTAPLLH